MLEYLLTYFYFFFFLVWGISIAFSRANDYTKIIFSYIGIFFVMLISLMIFFQHGVVAGVQIGSQLVLGGTDYFDLVFSISKQNILYIVLSCFLLAYYFYIDNKKQTLKNKRYFLKFVLFQLLFLTVVAKDVVTFVITVELLLVFYCFYYFTENKNEIIKKTNLKINLSFFYVNSSLIIYLVSLTVGLQISADQLPAAIETTLSHNPFAAITFITTFFIILSQQLIVVLHIVSQKQSGRTYKGLFIASGIFSLPILRGFFVFYKDIFIQESTMSLMILCLLAIIIIFHRFLSKNKRGSAVVVHYWISLIFIIMVSIISKNSLVNLCENAHFLYLLVFISILTILNEMSEFEENEILRPGKNLLLLFFIMLFIGMPFSGLTYFLFRAINIVLAETGYYSLAFIFVFSISSVGLIGLLDFKDFNKNSLYAYNLYGELFTVKNFLYLLVALIVCTWGFMPQLFEL